MGKATDSSLGEDLVVAMKSITRVFVGELVELARELMTEDPTETNPTGPIKPNYYKLAYERMQKERKLPSLLLEKKKKLFTK